MQGLLGSLAIHLLIVLLLIMPFMAGEVLSVREHRARAGAGVGPAGGGGGGTGGSGLMVEQLYWVPLGPAAAQGEEGPVEVPDSEPEPDPPKPAPEEPPLPVPEPTPPPPPPSAAPSAPQPASPPIRGAMPADSSGGAPIRGQGGGTGNDGTTGTGPGSGGGVGSGVGTGRGSGVGPGTGGSPADSIYPPTLLTLTLPPLDAPARLRPYLLVAYFDVDERGNTKLIGFNETPDSRFNRRVRDVLAEVRFRPAVRADGRPVRDTGRFEIEYP